MTHIPNLTPRAARRFCGVRRRRIDLADQGGKPAENLHQLASIIIGGWSRRQRVGHLLEVLGGDVVLTTLTGLNDGTCHDLVHGASSTDEVSHE